MTDEQAFLQALRASPTDWTLRLVYADWLEEQGDPRAEFLRLDVQLARRGTGKGAAFQRRLSRWQELRSTLDPVWIARAAQASHGIGRKHNSLSFSGTNKPAEPGWGLRIGSGGKTSQAVGDALRRLDGNVHFCEYLASQSKTEYVALPPYSCIPGLADLPGWGQHQFYYPGQAFFFILGGGSSWRMIGVFLDVIYSYFNPVGDERMVTVWAGGPGHTAPRSQVCFEIEQVLEATRFFYYHASVHPGLTWTATTPPWQTPSVQVAMDPMQADSLDIQ